MSDGNIYYKGKNYSEDPEVSITLKAQDAVSMDLTDEQFNTLSSGGTAVIQEVEAVKDEDGKLHLNLTVPASLVIANGVFVGENQKDYIWTRSQQVEEVALDQGTRLEFGTGGKRIVCAGLRVLIGQVVQVPCYQVNTAEGGSVTYSPAALAKSQYSNSPLSTYTDKAYMSGDTYTQTTTEDDSAICEFITPEDLYSSFSYGDKTITMRLYSKTNTYTVWSCGYADTGLRHLFYVPMNIDCCGMFLYTTNITSSNIDIYIGFAAFKNGELKAITPGGGSITNRIFNASINNYNTCYMSWKENSKEYEFAAGITAQYEHVTKDIWEEMAGPIETQEESGE